MPFDIDLDYEFKDFVLERGWWITLRSFDLTKRSKYWDDRSNEAIGGPPWKYNDIIFKGRRVEHIKFNDEDFFTRQQYTNVYDAVFYVASTIRPKKEDRLMETTDELRYLDKAPRRIRVIEQFEIKHVEWKIEDRLIFSKCYCSKITPKRDETIDGTIPVKYIKLL